MKKRILYLLVGLLISTTLMGQEPVLVKDINQLPTDKGGVFETTTYDGFVYFTKDDGVNGMQVWKTDGNTTTKVTAIDNDAYGDPQYLTAWNDTLYFSTSISGIWKTDGTTLGTEMVSSFSGRILPAANILYLFNEDSRYLAAFKPMSGEVTDTIKQVGGIAHVEREFATIQDKLFYTEYVDTVGQELFVTEGIAGETSVLDVVIPGSTSSYPASLTVYGDTLYFVAVTNNVNNNATGAKSIYKTDGTVGGTFEFEVLDNMYMGSFTTDYVELDTIGGKLLFYDFDGVATDIFAYNESSKSLLTSFNNNNTTASFRRLQFQFNSGDTSYFYTSKDNSAYYGKTAGNAVVQSPVDNNPFINPLKYAILNSAFIYSDDIAEELVHITFGGTKTTLRDLSSALSYSADDFTVLGNTVFFTSADDSEGVQLWKTDGTAVNTVRVTSNDIETSRNGRPTDFFVLKDSLFFSAYDGTNVNVYQSGGSSSNTSMTIAGDSILSDNSDVLGDYLYFNKGTNFIDQLLKTDGDTIMPVDTVEERISYITTSGNHLFFVSNTSNEGTELWVSDGSNSGTQVMDLYTGGSFSSSPDQLMDINGTLYFRALDPDEGSKGLWKSDGTMGGTEVVFSDVIGDIDNLTAIGPYIFFSVDDAIIGTEVKVYNTMNGSVASIDAQDGDSNPVSLAEFNGSLYYVHDDTSNMMLASIDTATFSYHPHYEVQSYPAYTSVHDLISTNQFLTFRITNNVNDIFNQYVLDTAGNVRLANFEIKNKRNTETIGDLLYYISSSDTLYVTDGTDRGRQIVSSIWNDGTTGLYPKLVYNDTLFFVTDLNNLGAEVYKYAHASQGIDFTVSSDLAIQQNTSGELDVSWTNGTGDGRLLLASMSSNIDMPEDHVEYTSDADFGNSELENGSNGYVVFNGSANSTTVTNLSPATKYYFELVDYANPGSGEFYYNRLYTQKVSFITSSLETINDTVCDMYTSPSGKYTWSTSGTYMDTIQNEAGGDSILTIHLIVNESTEYTMNAVVCDSMISPSSMYVWDSTGTYMDTILNAAGCDSVITVNLTVNETTYNTIQPEVCDSFVSPSGMHTWKLSGMYMDTIPNTAGCDSVITVDLTVNNSTGSTIDVSACDSFVSPSMLYTWKNSGTYMDTILNAAGCDSVITVNLTINETTFATIDTAVCESFVSPSSNYTWEVSGTYMDTISNAAGCDSVITVNLTIKESTSSEITETVCDSFVAPDGNVYTTSGVKTAIIPNNAGCDSIITINLTVNQSESVSITESACDSYTAPDGEVYTTSGVKTAVIQTVAGCDSTITIDLTITSIDNSVTQDEEKLTANMSGANYQWLDCDNNFAPISGAQNQEFTSEESGNYAVEVSLNGCVDTSDCFSVSIDAVGIGEQLVASDIRVYPNPTESKIHLDAGFEFKELQINAINVSGAVMKQVRFHNSEKILFELPENKGIYFLEIIVDNKRRTYVKVVKE